MGLSQVRDLDSILNGKNRTLTMRKPFGENAEGLIFENRRGDKTAIELFLAGLAGWSGEMRCHLAAFPASVGYQVLPSSTVSQARA